MDDETTTHTTSATTGSLADADTGGHAPESADLTSVANPRRITL